MQTIADVSFYQYGWNKEVTQIAEYVDFRVMRQKIDAVIIRAGQRDYKDIAFNVSWKLAKEAGLLRGSYWFYDSRAEPKRQAEKYIEVLGDDMGELPLWCDLEESYNGLYKGWKYWYDFIERLKALAPGKTIGIYTGYYYWLENTAGAPIASKDYFGQYPLWIARYGAEPLIPYPWDDWAIWQFTSSGDGSLYGVVSQEIDLNYWKGGADVPPAADSPIGENMNYTMRPIQTGTRLRVDHTTFATMIGSYGNSNEVGGDIIWTAPADGSEVKKGDMWLHVTHVDGVPVTNGWMAYIHKGQPICNNFQDFTGGTPPPAPEPTVSSQYIVTIDEATKRVILKRGDGQPMTGWTAVIG